MATKKTSTTPKKPEGQLPDKLRFAGDAKRWAKERADAKAAARDMNNYFKSRETGKKNQERVVASADSINAKGHAERWAKQRKVAESFATALNNDPKRKNYGKSRTAGKRKQKEIYSK